MSAVGVTMGVGKGVGVAVGGNQIMVGVTVVVGGTCVSVGTGVEIGAAAQAAHMKTNRQDHKKFFISADKIIRKLIENSEQLE